MRAKRTFVATLTGLSLCAVGVAGAASASESDGYRGLPPTAEVGPIETPDDLLKYAEAIPVDELDGLTENRVPEDVQALADRLWDEQPEGFGDVAWDAETGEATLWWHGEVPADVAEDVELLAVPAQIAAMTYSKAELNAAASDMVSAGGEISTAAPKVDGTGIEISFDDSIARRGAPAVPDSPYPIEVTEPVDASPAGGDDRYQTPYPPYAGGASIINGTGWVKICSTGWPVLIDNPAPLLQRKYGMMFASHCVTDTASSYWTTWPSEEYSGSRFFVGYTSLSTYRYGAGDAAIMVNDPTVSGVSDPTKLYYPYVYVGGPDSGGRYIITGTAAPVIGANWCMSGAPSGTTCNNKITATNSYVNYGPAYPTAGPLVRTESVSGLANVGEGDSGGPAILLATSGGPYAQVTGIISGMANGQSGICQATNDGRLCSSTAFISPYALIRDAMGIRAMTSSNYTE
ncbi:hypothetical protein CHO01_31520 [Cellulomonas hominis]|uniref:Peptidase S1 domain-containing protein n=1 Tax=Cellulomonas hominis TaxID=156981 RepID=A0A511FFL0_9CELL|nr:hypothetical protein [Cellulomonas hominis]MBB5474788.1 hypothetical protein [Cellulomonas hominis]NKY05807.1 hypothetical protein [Cellulomonas hominis]GEL48036.1 hypothetical protein CHO01_31520 [Cellulomonas hominis]